MKREHILCFECEYWVKGTDDPDKGRCHHPKRQNVVTGRGDITRVSANDYCAIGEPKDEGTNSVKRM